MHCAETYETKQNDRYHITIHHKWENTVMVLFESFSIQIMVNKAMAHPKVATEMVD